MAEHVRITEVGPRDGLQNEPGVIPTAEKVELVRLLCGTGVDEVEVTSFVSPRWEPQLGDAAEVLEQMGETATGVGPVFSALVPNERGMQGVIDANSRARRRQVAKVSVFTAASETFCRRNTNASIDETIQRFVPVVQQAQQSGLRVRGYVSCVIECPFEGPIAPEAVVDVSKKLQDIGIDELDLGDTIGAGRPESISALLHAVLRHRAVDNPETFTLHMHDTFGRAADCVKAALDLGVRSFDGSVAGASWRVAH